MDTSCTIRPHQEKPVIVFRTDVLKGAIALRYGTQSAFARAFPMTRADLNSILHNRRGGFTSISLNRWCQLLGLQPGDFVVYVAVADEDPEVIGAQ